MADTYAKLLVLADELETQSGEAAEAIRRAGTVMQRAKALDRVRTTLGALEMALAYYAQEQANG